MEGGKIIALGRRRRQYQPRARRPVRTVGRAARQSAPDLRRKPGATSNRSRRSATASGIGFLGLGMWPDKRRDELPIMPKGRYGIMLRHMPRVGKLGLDMMLRTCTIQVNLDYATEADMVKKFRVGLALQPLATALFANSPFTEGKPNGFLQLSQPHLDRHRSGAHRHAAVRVRGWLRLRALCRLCARRADVFRLPRRQLYRRRGPQLPRFPRRQIAGPAGRAADHRRLGRSSLDRLPRSAAEELPRNARRRRRAAGAGSAPCPPCGSGCSTSDDALDAAWDRVKHWSIEEREALAPRCPARGARRRGAGRRNGPRACRRSARNRQFGAARPRRDERRRRQRKRLPRPAARSRRVGQDVRGLDARTLPRRLERRRVNVYRDYSF